MYNRMCMRTRINVRLTQTTTSSSKASDIAPLTEQSLADNASSNKHSGELSIKVQFVLCNLLGVFENKRRPEVRASESPRSALISQCGTKLLQQGLRQAALVCASTRTTPTRTQHSNEQQHQRLQKERKRLTPARDVKAENTGISCGGRETKLNSSSVWSFPKCSSATVNMCRVFTWREFLALLQDANSFAWCVYCHVRILLERLLFLARLLISLQEYADCTKNLHGFYRYEVNFGSSSCVSWRSIQYCLQFPQGIQYSL